MPEENDELKKGMQEIVENVSTVDENLKTLGIKVDTAVEKTDRLENKLLKEVNVDDDDDDLDTFAKPNEIKKKVVKEIRSEIKKKFDEEREKSRKEREIERDKDKYEVAYNNACNKFDKSACERYPDLRNENSEFFKLVEKELDKVKAMYTKDGVVRMPPDSVLNAANSVAVSNPNKYINREYHEEIEGPVGFFPRIKGKDMTDAQKQVSSYYIRKFGLDPEKVKARYKTHNKSLTGR